MLLHNASSAAGSLAHGYDGWYYVLQVRSLLEGAALFGDRSLVFPLLTGLAWLTDDAVVACRIAAGLFGGLTALGGLWFGRQWGGTLAAGVACGAWWALSPLRLGISAEYLKNSGGVAVLALLLAALACRGRGAMIAAVFLALLGPLVHKLTGVLGLAMLAGVVAHRLLDGRRPPKWMLVASGLGMVGVLAAGLLRPEDLARLTGGSAGEPRWMLVGTGRLIVFEKLELALAHLAPILLGLALLCRPALRMFGLPLLAISVVVLAPGLPLGWDLTAWRLLLMGFLPVGLLAAIAASRWSLVAPVVVLAGLLALPANLTAQRGRSPDYAALSAMLPLLQSAVPDGDRIVAHRGLCGFIWAQADIACENFQPQGDLSGWWRVAYGFSTERLESAGAQVTPIALVPGYILVHEPDWQRFVDGPGDRFSLTRNPRNPYRPRPGFVYAPEP